MFFYILISKGDVVLREKTQKRKKIDKDPIDVKADSASLRVHKGVQRSLRRDEEQPLEAGGPLRVDRKAHV